MDTTVQPIGLHPLNAGDTISTTIIPSGQPIAPLYDASQRGYAVDWNTRFRITMYYLSHQFNIILLL
jgi:hypothetical protein